MRDLCTKDMTDKIALISLSPYSYAKVPMKALYPLQGINEKFL